MSSNHSPPSDLSDRQRTLIQSAAVDGYFEVPREISTVELAEKHDMSSREALEELHRGLGVLVCDAGFDD